MVCRPASATIERLDGTHGDRRGIVCQAVFEVENRLKVTAEELPSTPQPYNAILKGNPVNFARFWDDLGAVLGGSGSPTIGSSADGGVGAWVPGPAMIGI